MDERTPAAGGLVRCILWLLWQCIRVPALLLLVVLEPVVSFVLSSLALLGVLTAFFWKFVGPPRPRSLERDQSGAACHIQHLLTRRQGREFHDSRSDIGELRLPEWLIEIGRPIPSIALDTSLEVGVHES
jgi:hypothetical protein